MGYHAGMENLGTPESRRQEERDYGDWVAARLKMKGWNQSTLSRETGIKRQTIGQIVNGGAMEPPARQVAAIAKALDATPNDIFTAAGWWTPERCIEGLTPNQLDAARLIAALPMPAQEVALQQLKAMQGLSSRPMARLHEEQQEVELDYPEHLPRAAHGETTEGIEEWSGEDESQVY